MNLRYSNLTARNYRKNRTIVSKDVEGILGDIAREIQLPITIHRYPSGTDLGTWVVPASWDVNDAWIKGPDGTLIASYKEHPLFLVPYSQPFKGVVSRTQLQNHVHFHPKRANDFYYDHRFTYDYQKRLSDWAVTLPKSRFDALPEGDYTVNLDITIEPGEMLVGEISLPGESRDVIALLTDYCHPGQVNDSWSGILAMIDVINELKQKKTRRYTYKLYFFPETIGSCIFLEANPSMIELTKLAIFSECVGWGRNWKILSGDHNNSMGRHIAKIACTRDTDFQVADLSDGYGNDEIIYDYVGTPSLSVQMTEFDEYHSSSDKPDLLEQQNIDKASSTILDICDIMEKNRFYRFRQMVPIYMTRFNLYADAVTDEVTYRRNRNIMAGLRDGHDLVNISRKYSIDFDDVCDYVERLVKNDLLDAI